MTRHIEPQADPTAAGDWALALGDKFCPVWHDRAGNRFIVCDGAWAFADAAQADAKAKVEVKRMVLLECSYHDEVLLVPSNGVRNTLGKLAGMTVAIFNGPDYDRAIEHENNVRRQVMGALRNGHGARGTSQFKTFGGRPRR